MRERFGQGSGISMAHWSLEKHWQREQAGKQPVFHGGVVPFYEGAASQTIYIKCLNSGLALLSFSLWTSVLVEGK